MYVPGAVMLHAVAPDALTEAWFKARAWEHGRADAAIARVHASSAHLWRTSARRLADVVLQLGAASVLGLGRRHRMRLWCQYRLRYSCAYLLRLIER